MASTLQEQIWQDSFTSGVRPYKRLTQFTMFNDSELTESTFPEGTTNGWAHKPAESKDPSTHSLEPYNFYTFANNWDQWGLPNGLYTMMVTPDNYRLAIDIGESDSNIRSRNLFVANGTEDFVELTAGVDNNVTGFADYIWGADGYDLANLDPGDIKAVQGYALDGHSSNDPYDGNVRAFLAFRTPQLNGVNEYAVFVPVITGDTAVTITTGLVAAANNGGQSYQFRETIRHLNHAVLYVTVDGTYSATDNKLVVRAVGDTENHNLYLTSGQHYIPLEITRIVSKGDNIKAVYGLNY